jgi:hypothetical protein
MLQVVCATSETVLQAQFDSPSMCWSSSSLSLTTLSQTTRHSQHNHLARSIASLGEERLAVLAEHEQTRECRSQRDETRERPCLTLAFSTHPLAVTQLEFPNYSSTVLTNIHRILLLATVYIVNTISTTRALLSCTSSCAFIFSLSLA